MQQYRDAGFILKDNLTFDDFGNGIITLTGRIECLYGLYIDVTKTLQIVDGTGHNARVQTVSYSYDAAVPKVGNVFRYDSPHPDHHQNHHVHRFEIITGGVEGVVTFHGIEGWPTLGEVIGELRDWAASNADWLTAQQQRRERRFR